MGIGFEEQRGPLSGTQSLHYRIGELIGAGGMGQVYRATDTRLQRTVAVKSLPGDVADNPTVRERFVREARLAGRVVHPYVATVLDVVDSDDRLLVVLEYIEGKTLAAALVDEEPDLDRSLTRCREITEALGAIHAAEVLHRDLKPGNIMVMPTGHIKLMDFGLARRMEPLTAVSADPTRSWEAPLTAAGAVVGTLLYMSPEQLRGEELDARSDLFSLGTVFYQALTGVHPFARGTPTASAAAILHEAPGPPDADDPLTALPTAVDATIRRLLSKDAAERFASCAEVLDALRESAIEEKAAVPGMRHGRVLAVVLSLALATTVAVGGWSWVQRPPAFDGPRVALAVLPFDDQTGSGDGTLLAGMVGSWLAAELESSHLARTAGPSQTTPLVRSLSTGAGPAEITRRVATGITVDYVLIGTLFRDGDDYLATLEVESARSDVPPIAAVRARGGSPLQVAERLASRLRRELPDVSRIDAYRDGRAGVDDITSASPEARLLFEKGLVATGEHRFVAATDWFERATDADPEFALAWVHLADVYDRTGFARQAREAAERAKRQTPTGDGRAEHRLALQIEAVRSRAYSRNDDEVAATDALTVLFPDEPALIAWHGRALGRAGRYDEAVNRFGLAVGLDDRSAEYRLELATVLRQVDRFDEASQALREAESLFTLLDSMEGLASVEAARARLLWDQGAFEDAIERFEMAATLYEQAGRDASAASLRLDVAQLQLIRGSTVDVPAWIATARAVGERLGDTQLLCAGRMTEAGLHHRLREWDEAIVAYADAVDLARQLGNDELMADPLANLGAILVYRKRREEARGVLAESIEISRRLGRHAGLASALAAKGQLEHHLGELNAALEAFDALVRHADEHDLTRWNATANRRRSLVYLDRGELTNALESADAAVAGFEAADLPPDLCKALLARAKQLAWLGRGSDARTDLERATALAADPDPAMQRLARDVALARAETVGREGDWTRTLAILGERYDDDAALRKSSTALRLTCDAHVALGHVDEALAPCEWAVERAVGRVAAEAAALASFALALAEAGRFEDAAREARAAFTAAERPPLRLALAYAAAALQLLPGDLVDADERERIVTTGSQALEQYLGSAPPGTRTTLEERAEITRIRDPT